MSFSSKAELDCHALARGAEERIRWRGKNLVQLMRLTAADFSTEEKPSNGRMPANSSDPEQIGLPKMQELFPDV